MKEKLEKSKESFEIKKIKFFVLFIRAQGLDETNQSEFHAICSKNK
jgi:hypothetical protein